MTPSAHQHRLSLEDIALLNDEICALARAGVPLELGLRSTASGLRRQAAAVVDTLADHVSAGHTLDEAMELQQDSFPAAYRALVTAGIKSGHLDQALASMSNFARSLDRFRQGIGLSLFYPTLVLLAAWGLWAMGLLVLFPIFDSATIEFGAGEGSVRSLFRTAAANVSLWFPTLPLAILFGGATWWTSQKWLFGSHNRRAGWHPGRASAALIRRLPWIGPILSNFHLANFTELLALLLQHEVPLSQAVSLAIDASGDTTLSSDRDQIVTGIENGDSLGKALQASRTITPFLHWMLQSAESLGTQQNALAQATTILRQRAEHRVEWFELVFPALVLAIVGGGTVLIYSLSVFLPTIELFDTLNRS